MLSDHDRIMTVNQRRPEMQSSVSHTYSQGHELRILEGITITFDIYNWVKDEVVYGIYK